MNSETNNVPRVAIVLPYFPGFFESSLDDGLDSALEQNADWYADENEFEPSATAEEFTDAAYHVADWRKAYIMVAREWLEQFENMVHTETGLALHLEFDEVNSPREYNFRTDRVIATIPADVLRAMRERVKPETWAAVLAEHFKSRSGFISFYPHDPEAYARKDAALFDPNEAMALIDAFMRDNVDTGSYSNLGEWLSWEIEDTLHSNNVFEDAFWTAAPMGEIEARIRQDREEEKETGA